MTFESLFAFFLITVIATAIPGPTMLYIASCGLSQGRKSYLAATCGVLVADLIYFILTITGLSVILLASYELFSLIKWLGVAYLIYLGVKLIRSDSSINLKENNNSTCENVFPETFLKGFFIHIANPKTILFFSALLPQFIDPEQPLLFQISLIGIVLILTQAGVSIIYGATANRIRMHVSHSYIGKKLNLISGFLFVAAGVWLATVQREGL